MTQKKYNELNILLKNDIKEYNIDKDKVCSDILITKMSLLLMLLKVKPEIFPTNRNSIQFQYEKDNGDYLEFELLEDGSVNILEIKDNNIILDTKWLYSEIVQKVDEWYGFI